jgi:hypothetical protein
VVDTAAAAGPWEFGASAGTGYFSHYSGGGFVDYRVHSITPVVRFHGRPPAWDIRVSAQRRLEFYDGAAVDSITQTSDHNADNARLSLVREWSALERFTLDASYARSHDLLDTDEATLVMSGNTMRLRGEGNLETYRIEGDGYWKVTDYEDGPGSAVGSATGRLLGLRSRIQTLVLGWSEEHYFTGRNHVLGKHAPFVGYRRRVSPLWSVELMGGAVRTDSDDHGVQTLPLAGLVLRTPSDADAPYDVSTMVRFEGDSLAALDARLAHRLGNGSVWLRGSSLTDVDAVVDENPLRTRTIAIGVRDTVLLRNVVSLEAGYSWSDGLYSGEQYREGLRAAGSWLYRFAPWLSARLGVSYLNQPEGASGRVEAFRRLRSDIELIATNP